MRERLYVRKVLDLRSEVSWYLTYDFFEKLVPENSELVLLAESCVPIVYLPNFRIVDQIFHKFLLSIFLTKKTWLYLFFVRTGASNMIEIFEVSCAKKEESYQPPWLIRGKFSYFPVKLWKDFGMWMEKAERFQNKLFSRNYQNRVCWRQRLRKH